MANLNYTVEIDWNNDGSFNGAGDLLGLLEFGGFKVIVSRLTQF